MIQSKSANHAKQYFREALSKADYYLKDNDQELPGRMFGKLADRLNITGLADKDIFYQLCDNINPVLGGNLTPRTKEERTVGYDINFHVSKSVSIAYAFSKDDHILKAFEAAMNETLKEIEADSMTRVRKGGRDENRASGEMIIASFIHKTARPADGMPPDMHLHGHAYFFNAAYCPVEREVKACQFREIKRNMPYYQAKFQKRMADSLTDLGYGIRKTENNFEIEHIPQSVIAHFSKRSDQIGRYIKENNITDPDELREVAAKTRGKKQSGLSMDELKAIWRKQIKDNINFSPDEMNKDIRFSKSVKEQKIIAKDCGQYSIEHSFTRASVMQDKRLMANAIQYSIGERNISIQDAEQAIMGDARLIQVKQGDLNFCTTTEVLTEEREMVNMARNGQGKLRPLYDKEPDVKYDGDQGAAIKHVLTTPNQTSIIRGVAGAGKTTAMLELDRLVKEVGKQAYYVTPMAQTARETMPIEGFENANTVAKLLDDREFQNKLKGQVLVLEEGGQVPVADMSAVLRIIEKQQAQLIIVGDVKQHTPTMRGDALRVIHKVGGIHTAEVSKIYRQRNNPQYLAAVEDLAKGSIGPAFEKLDDMGVIKEIDHMQPNKELAEEYVRNIKKGNSTLVVSPTNKQRKAINRDIRAKMRDAGLIGKRETEVRKLDNLNYTDAQKGDWRNYEPGQIIQFTQNVPKIGRGSVWQLKDISDKGIVMENHDGDTRNLPLDRAKNFSVYRETKIGLSKGDQIKITNGGFDFDNKRLSNGQMMEVMKLAKDGGIHLKNNISNATYTIDKEFGHIDHAYCSTSHSSQGKSVDTVLISQPAETFTATNAKQFYVSVSRGKQTIQIYTDDKERLLEHASQLGDRQSAMELIGDNGKHENHIIQMELDQQLRREGHAPQKELTPQFNNYFEDYEPGL